MSLYSNLRTALDIIKALGSEFSSISEIVVTGEKMSKLASDLNGILSTTIELAVKIASDDGYDPKIHDKLLHAEYPEGISVGGGVYPANQVEADERSMVLYTRKPETKPVEKE